ncbi:MAG: sel1 repeat family protein [Spirochaetaceae bacterium]|jgi:TPR repeat protein|nr:sel1 repeat family protein [Spirochaetaceae bacterium]
MSTLEREKLSQMEQCEVGELEKKADGGDSISQLHLGLMLKLGEGVAQDLEKAVYWYTKAAEQGDADAQDFLAECYFNGYGIGNEKYPLKKGKYWYEKSAEQGNADAQLWLGCCYFDGDGTKKEDWKAIRWWLKAAEQGNKPAQSLLMKYFPNSWPKKESNSGGCYIATAVYGSYDAPSVMTLRHFRDEYLAKSLLGRLFISIYYKLSPQIANSLRNTVIINRLVRCILDRFVIRLRDRHGW